MSGKATFLIEYATRGGDMCGECKRAIVLGALRIGRVVTASGGSRTVTTWYHPAHLFQAMKRWKPSSRRVLSVADLEGVDDLKPSDIRYVKGLITGDDIADAMELLSLPSSGETKRPTRNPMQKPRASSPRSPTSATLTPSHASRRSTSPVRRDQTPMHDSKGEEAPPSLTQAERERWYEVRRTIVRTPRPIDLFHRRYVTKAKFWEIDVSGNTVTTRWGPIGKTGQVLSQSYATESEARAYAAAKVKEKTRKGYLAEVTNQELAR
jgi:predicted DNA-binding WGR domain protein